ncbi:MAG: hypothetical protein D6767_06260 [Candidatus Hydrogenedentota bacterium]|nr:MAG: hypothetical protein D6767_06260 [Candidatus Hydrogenedentota bacterium]
MAQSASQHVGNITASEEQVRALLRLFIQLQADLFFIVQQGNLIGYLQREDLTSLLSDLSVLNNPQIPIPLQQVPSEEILLELFEKRSIEHMGKTVIPVINSRWELTGYWTRSETIQNYASVKLPKPWYPAQVEEWKPKETALPSDESLESSNADSALEPVSYSSTPDTKEKLKIHIKVPPLKTTKNHKNETHKIVTLNPSFKKETIKEETNPSTAKQDTVQEKKKPLWKLEIEKGKLAIFTLEALTIPIAAIDRQGLELFVNEEWQKLRKLHEKELSPSALNESMKQVIAKEAMHGSLDVDSYWVIPVYIDHYEIRSRRIRDESDTIIGYIFWAIEKAQPSNTMPIISNEAFDLLNEEYEGKNFQEIIQNEEKKLLLWAYRKAGHNFTEAAKLVGMPRQTFSYKFHKYFRKTITEKET